MLPPYDSDEVAAAVQRRLASSGVTLATLTVSADILARTWRIEARCADGADVVAHYPFSMPSGIHTPAELAAWFAAECAGRTERR